MERLEAYRLKKFVNMLKVIRGRHTELVSVYIPTGYELNKIINHLAQEQGTASNIKDKTTRKNVIDSLEKMIRHLRLFKKTPENGLAVFAGNIAAQEGKTDLKVWSIEPPIPLNFRLYRCDQTFVLDELEKMLDVKEVYGLIAMDNRDAAIGLLKGTSIIVMKELTSGVPGKAKAGGQCNDPNTPIICSDGNIIKIKNSHNPFILKSMDLNNFMLKDSPITNKWIVNRDKVYEIITRHPQLRIRTSKDHIFFVHTKEGIIEKSAEELKNNDVLLMPEKINIKGKTHKLNSKKYYNSFIITNRGRRLLNEIRLEKKLYQKQLAKIFGLTQTAISAVELGKRNIRRDFLEKLCGALSIDFEKFLDEFTEPFKYRDINLPEELDKEFAQFLGYFLGDGSAESDRITFFEQRKNVALHYKEKFNKYFGLNSSYKFRESKNYHQIRFVSRPLVRLIKNQFPELRKTFNSEIPMNILTSNDEIVGSFLKGLFDAEGYVTRGSVSIAMVNKYLIQQLQLVLLRFSILSSYSEYDNKRNPYSKKPIFKLRISEKKSLQLFKKNIGFIAEDKSKKLTETIKNKSEKSHVRQILINGSEIRKIIEKCGHNLQLFPKVSGFFRDKRLISKQAFEGSILSRVKDPVLYKKLEEIYNYNILPISISKIIVEYKKEKLIDISVKNQNFIANGILVHNSSVRFARLREEAKHEFYKRIAGVVNKEFSNMKDLKGILVGGPGMTKETFVNGDYMDNKLREKVIAIKDLSYTGEFGLNELVEKSKDKLAEEEITKEKELVNEFLEMLARNSDKTAYGREEVKKALEMGAVSKLLISESFDAVEEFEALAGKYGSEVYIISTDSREGIQLRDMGGVVAILRYAIG